MSGFAAAHDREPSPEMVLLGLCWNLEHPLLGRVPRTQVVAALATHGETVPAGQPPVDAELGERVDVPLDLLRAVRQALQRENRLLGFNVDTENDEAWVVISGGDTVAAELIQQVLRRPTEEQATVRARDAPPTLGDPGSLN